MIHLRLAGLMVMDLKHQFGTLTQPEGGAWLNGEPDFGVHDAR
jgi:hypothetical protein